MKLKYLDGGVLIARGATPRTTMLFFAALLVTSAAQAAVVTITGADVALLTGSNRTVFSF